MSWHRTSRTRWPAAFAVLAALVTMTVGPADAAKPHDQITGTGLTGSAVTASWSQGLLGADNKTVVTPRDQSGPLSFMYPDFQNLKVTVSQTDGIVHQALAVTWSGLFSNGTNGGFLQIMQCYGDSNSGPDPENCEFGTPANLLPSGLVNASAGSRGGAICTAGAVPSTTKPPSTIDGIGPSAGCDTKEPLNSSHLDPSSDNADSYSVPFIPAGTTQKVYQAKLGTEFDQFHTNEVQQAVSGADGTGQDYFQALTSTEAPGLGCGQAESVSKTRNCWLVAVPRGQYNANGFRISGTSAQVGNLTSSPLGASEWAQRIQVHLNFAAIAQKCPIGSAQERETVGTGLVSHAVFSWQLALNATTNCKTLYGYSEAPEATNTSQLSDPNGAGLAFTTDPIGSEAVRSGSLQTTGPPLVYAPVAVSAITFGFNVNLPSTNGFDPNPIKLTPRLLAKALTQSYQYDLPDFFPSGSKLGRAWAQHNPFTMAQDPEFKSLNPGVQDGGAATSLAPLLTEDHSGVNQQVWEWILADKSARAWLAGTPDENGMVVNPTYKSLNLSGPPAIDSYPRADPTCFNTGGTGEQAPGRCSLNLLPYVNDLEDGASRVRAANDPLGPGWDPGALAPDGSSGWWTSGTLEGPNTTFMWSITDSSNLAAYGLVPAELCSANGLNCLGPNDSSISAALLNATTDSTGLINVDPAAPGVGAYPLVDVTYAAVRTTQSPTELQDFATLIDYAAGSGQTPGVDAGQLPSGYLPLPTALRTQASAVATTLRTDANAPPPSTPNTSTQGTTGNQPSGNGSNPSNNNGTNPSTNNQNPSGATNPASAGNPSVTPGSPVLAARATPNPPLGPIRWVLLVVVVAGAVGALGGGLLRSPNLVTNVRNRLNWLRR